MQTRLFLAIGTAAWLITAQAATAEEPGMDSGTQTETSDSTGDNGSAMKGDKGVNVEHRRNDHSRGAGSDRSSFGGASGRSGGNDGGGSDGGGSDSGGGGGDVD